MTDISFNFVALVETKPITRLSDEYNSKLLSKIKETFTETQQNLFVSSFYCYLNYNQTTDFVIDLDNIWQWLGFNAKQNAKLLLEKNFIMDKDYKVLLMSQHKQTNDTRGGHNKQTFMLNIRTFKLFCIKAGTQKASEIHEYFVKLEDILNEIVSEESNEIKNKMREKEFLLQKKEEEKKELENKLVQAKEENKLLQHKEDTPIIYIYNIDTRMEKPELKIGYTKNINNRIRPYKQISKYGKLELHIEVPEQNIRTVENFIHYALSNYVIKDEVFRIDVDEAKMIVLRIINTLNIVKITNVSERQLKLSQLYETETRVIENANPDNISTREISTQTCKDDFIEPYNAPQNQTVQKDEQTKKFDKFIEDYCIVRPDVEVSTTDIIGQYRIVNQSASKEVYQKMLHYLSTRFTPSRLKKQDKNGVVNGYMGVTLKELCYTKSLESSDEQNFIYHSCIFSPSGKVLFSDLLEEYKKWKSQLHKEISQTDEEHLKKYLKNTNYVLYTTIWANNGGGQGYYGLCLKKDMENHKTTSSTGKKVEKRDYKTNELLGTWETISKAAETEKICAAKMSRSIKNKIIFNNDYYYCTC